MAAPILNYRFNLQSYLDESKNKEASSKNDSFQKLLSSYTSQLQYTLSDREWQLILSNKSVTQLFLDKVSRIYPKGHPVLSQARKFDWNSSTFASMEMVRYLKLAQTSTYLTKKAGNAIAKWIEQEIEYLPNSILIDGWRTKNPKTLQAIKEGWMDSSVALKEEEIDALQPEIEVLANQMLDKLTALKEGESFKFLGGSFTHEVRIVFKKFDENTIIVNSYDPSMRKIVQIFFQTEQIQNLTFFTKLIQAKLKTNTNTDLFLQQTLQSGGRLNIVKLKLIEDEYSKSPQIRDTCAVQAILKEFKHFFLSHYEPKSEGYEQYKMVKALMIREALQTPMDPELLASLQLKNVIRGRVIDWVGLDQSGVNQIFDFYKKTLAILEPNFDTAPFLKEKSDAGIAFLDHKLNSHLKRNVSIEDRNKLDEICKGFNIPTGFIQKIKYSRKLEAAHLNRINKLY